MTPGSPFPALSSEFWGALQQDEHLAAKPVFLPLAEEGGVRGKVFSLSQRLPSSYSAAAEPPGSLWLPYIHKIQRECIFCAEEIRMSAGMIAQLPTFQSSNHSASYLIQF